MHWDMPAFYMYGWFVNLSALLVLNCWILKSLFTKNSKRSGRLSATNWIRRYTCTQNCRSVASPSSPIGLPQGFGFSVWISNPSERRPQGLLLPLGLPYRILCLESRRKIGSDVRAVRAVRMLPTDVRRSFKKIQVSGRMIMGQPKLSFEEGLMPLIVSFKIQTLLRRTREMVSVSMVSLSANFPCGI